MKRHLRASGGDTKGRTASPPTVRREAPRSEDHITRTRPRARRRGRPDLRLASASSEAHTLELTGELNHASAHMLEAEIDRLCEEGVDRITLDLRGVTEIDATGVVVIAYRCELCKRRGHDFELIQGSRSVHRAFERAGVAGLLPFRTGVGSRAVDQVGGAGAAPAS
jgi:anti-anti-sigma factor